MSDPARHASGERDKAVAWPVRYSILGVQFAICLALATYAGVWVDEKLGTEPWGTLAGAILGFAGATMWLYREVYTRKNDSRAEKA